MTFSVNQVNHLYVATANKATAVVNSDKEGTAALLTDKAKTHMYLSYRGAAGVTRSDLIDIKNILYAKATNADSLAYKIKTATVTLNDTVNGGMPIAGQDYVLRITFRQYVGMSDTDIWNKHGMVHAYSGMSKGEFYEQLAVSLFRNFSKEHEPIVSFTLGGKVVAGVKNQDGKFIALDANNNKITGDATGIVITELPQEWRLGVKEQVPVYFEVYPTTVVADGEERQWGSIALGTDGTIDNGKKIADLEYFLMGERADQYRGIAWPHNLETEYMVDPSKKYHLFNIHYAYVGANEGPQKSEKDITIAVADSDKAVLTALIEAFNTATGLEVEDIA